MAEVEAEMSRQHWLAMAIVCSAMLFCPQAARAQQTVNLNFLTFDVDAFNGGSIGGEWLLPVGRYIEAGAGVSFTRRTVESFYTRLVNDDRSNINQDLRLRMVPAAFTFRVLPLGQDRAVQPYVGGGLN